MHDTKRAAYHRLVRASLLIEEASSETTRAAGVAANARDAISRISEGLLELHRLLLAEDLGMAGRLAGALLTETGRARDGLDLMHTSVRKSSECTQEASTLIKVA